MFHVFCDSLEKAQGLIKDNGHCDLGQFLRENTTSVLYSRKQDTSQLTCQLNIFTIDIFSISPKLKFCSCTFE